MPDVTDTAEATPRDPFEDLRAAGAKIDDAQWFRGRGKSAGLFHEDASVAHGEALAEARKALDALDPPIPARSTTVTTELLRAVEFTRTAEDDGERKETVRLWREAMDPPDPDARRPVDLVSITGDLPAPILSTTGRDGQRDGALLTVGTVALLAGAGGHAKTALALQIALTAAATTDGAAREACGGALVVAGGPVLFATWEDAPPLVQWRAARLVEHLGDGLGDGFGDAMRRVHLLPMAARPLFGPSGDGESYHARPGPLAGWADLWSAVEATEARLVVIDPALAAFVGESNAAAPVREFLGALAAEADKRNVGVLLIAHANKQSREQNASIYDAGKVGGSTHWTDGARGALTLTRCDGERYLLAVAKANYGPAYRHCIMRPIRPDGGAVVGLSGDAWHDGEPPKPDGPKPDKATGAADRKRDTSADGVV